MRNEKKYNKSIYFTMVFVQTIIHLVLCQDLVQVKMRFSSS